MINTPGKIVLRANGKRARLANGKLALYNSAGLCPACCPHRDLPNIDDPDRCTLCVAMGAQPIQYLIDITGVLGYPAGVSGCTPCPPLPDPEREDTPIERDCSPTSCCDQQGSIALNGHHANVKTYGASSCGYGPSAYTWCFEHRIPCSGYDPRFAQAIRARAWVELALGTTTIDGVEVGLLQIWGMVQIQYTSYDPTITPGQPGGWIGWVGDGNLDYEWTGPFPARSINTYFIGYVQTDNCGGIDGSVIVPNEQTNGPRRTVWDSTYEYWADNPDGSPVTLPGTATISSVLPTGSQLGDY